MKTAIFQSDSKSDLKTLTDLAKKIGVSVRYISDEELEDLGLANAIKEGRTKKYVETKEFLSSLKE